MNGEQKVWKKVDLFTEAVNACLEICDMYDELSGCLGDLCFSGWKISTNRLQHVRCRKDLISQPHLCSLLEDVGLKNI